MTRRATAARFKELEKLRDTAVINFGKGERTPITEFQWKLLQEGFDEQKRLGQVTPELMAAATALGLNVD